MTDPMVVCDGNTTKNKNDIHVRPYAERVPFPKAIIIAYNSSRIDDDACFGGKLTITNVCQA